MWIRLLQWWRSLPRDRFQIVPGKGWPRKNVRKRKSEPDQVVIHESVTSSREAAHSVLTRRGLSVEYTVERDGSVHQHVADVADTRCIHAGGKHNARSVAIEVINEYYGKRANDGDEVLQCAWAHKKRYIMPTAEQLESVWRLLCHLDTVFETDLRRFPGIVDGRFRWGRLKDKAGEPGTMAHHRWHHADGLFPEHYCVARDLGYAPADALRMTREAATSGKRWTELPPEVDQ